MAPYLRHLRAHPLGHALAAYLGCWAAILLIAAGA